jgi:hypothetical protein
MEGIKKAMNERNLNEGQWEDRKQLSRGVGQRRKTPLMLYMDNKLNFLLDFTTKGWLQKIWLI